MPSLTQFADLRRSRLFLRPRLIAWPVSDLGVSIAFSVLGDKAAGEIARAASLDELATIFDRRGAAAVAHLCRALGKCQAGDVYDAALALFECLCGDPWFELAVEDDQSGSLHRPHIRINERKVMAVAAAAWMAPAAKLCDDLCAIAANNAGKAPDLPPLTEALVLAVARRYCVLKRYDDAHRLVQRLLTISRKSIYLRAAETAVGLLLKGDIVPGYLQKFVGVDPNVLADRFCPVPFARVDVHQRGEVVMCCTHWLPTQIGNVFSGTAESILNSDTAKAIRRSVVDGSFKYCSHTDCELIINNKLPFKKDYIGKDFDDEFYHIDRQILSDAFELKAFQIPNVSYLIFCLDRTCNLTCPSCRTNLIMVRGEERDRLYDATERAVLPMLKNAKRVMVNPAGEAFVSRPSRRLMESLSKPGYESLVIDVITNGTVCDRAEWDKFSHLYGRLNIVRVSVDGASKATIEKLRRGADYDVLLSNLKNLQRMHRAGYFKQFYISFTYQRDNLHEMESFVEFGRELGVTCVIFERLQNVGAFTSEEYYARAVHLIDHPLHQEFLRIATRVKRERGVYIDFDPPAPQDTATQLAQASP